MMGLSLLAFLVLVALVLNAAFPPAPKGCPTCRMPARRALVGLLPVWACMRGRWHDEPGRDPAPEPRIFGCWAWLGVWVRDHLSAPACAFHLAPEIPFWYPRALWALLTGRGVVPED